MNSSSEFHPDDEIMASFMLELERAEAGGIDLASWVTRHPQLAERFHDAIRLQRQLNQARPSDELPIPERLGEFRILRRIGRGGMGDVYEAVQESLDRRVALKTIRHGRLSEELRARFLREQKVLARLHQTNIVSIHTAGREGAIQFIAMPYIEGAALDHVLLAASNLDPTDSSSGAATLGVLARLAADRSTVCDVDTVTVGAEFRSDSIVDSGNRQKRRRGRLSREYYRSVARVMSDVAKAVQHANKQDILHRDLKPSNIMVDESEQSWIIDFGLAHYVGRSHETETIEDIVESESGPPPTNPVGTPQYMAPEQYDGVPDVRSDVWGLGATLYELLTMRRAFDGDSVEDIRQKVTGADPVPPRKVAKGLPRELDALCLKAMNKRPERRYESAAAFGEDLDRWLADVPTKVLPPRVPRRIWNWTRRNKGWTVAILMCVIVVSLSVALMILSERAEAREARRQSLILEAQNIRLTSRFDGWREESRHLIREASVIKSDTTIRDQAAATLIGLDARIAKHFPNPASSAVFGPEGKRLILGGVGVWDRDTDRLRFSENAPGPVAFSIAQEPLQFVPRLDRIEGERSIWRLDTYSLRNLSQNRSIGEFEIPTELADTDLESFETPPMALSVNASFAAASPTFYVKDVQTGKEMQVAKLAVWNTMSGELIGQFSRKITGVAFSPDEKLLAAGDDEGLVIVWSLPELKEVARIRSGRNKIHCLGFSPNRLRRDVAVAKPQPRPNWILAVGDAGGSVAVWDLATQSLRNRLDGGHYNIRAVAIGPDGTTLAAAGRGLTRLLDFSTGTKLLELDSGDHVTGLSFSPNGQQLAVTTAADRKDANIIWDLEYGDGIQTMRGLAAQVTKIAFSHDGELIAALGHNWQLAVWHAPTGHLLHVFETPRGVYADNAALAFSPDSRTLAFITKAEARLWDVDAGAELNRWELPPGLADAIAFDIKGRILSFRMETKDGRRSTNSYAPQDLYPRVSRIRELLPEGKFREIAQYDDHAWRVRTVTVDQFGRYFVADGDKDGDRRGSSIQAYDAATGVKLWSKPVTRRYELLEFDPSGTILAAAIDDSDRTTLLDMPSGRVKGTLPHRVSCLCSKADLYLKPGPLRFRSQFFGRSLYKQSTAEQLVTLGIDDHRVYGPPSFSLDGKRVAWGNSNGTVTVCDLAKIRRRLSELRLGW